VVGRKGGQREALWPKDSIILLLFSLIFYFFYICQADEFLYACLSAYSHLGLNYAHAQQQQQSQLTASHVMTIANCFCCPKLLTSFTISWPPVEILFGRKIFGFYATGGGEKRKLSLGEENTIFLAAGRFNQF